jgi:octaprenyl-diphosphate synthase
VIAEGEVMQLGTAKNTATNEDEYLSVIRAKTAELFAAACEVGPALAAKEKAELAACRSFGMNLGIAFQLIDDALDYGGKSAKLGKNVGDDFRFWNRTLGEGDIREGDLDQAVALMAKHHSIEDTVGRARHYGAIATDALALVPPSEIKSALEEAVAFCIGRAH